MLPTPQIARQIVEVIGQSGTPPPNGVGYYNVGNERLLDIIEKHYFESYLAEGGAVFKLIVGDYGAGKSHFLYCLRDLAWRHDFVVSKVDLSPKESPYDDQKRVYAAVAGNILWHEGGESSQNNDEKGLVRFLEGTLRRLVAPHGLDIHEAGTAELPEVRATLQTLAMTPIDSLSYQKAIQGYFTALLDGKNLLLESLTRWLHGDEISPDDYKNLRAIGVTDKITRNNAFKMLRSLCQTVRALSYNGLVLLFDEGDRMMSIGGKSEQNATDNLREVIDRCRDELPGAMFVYAVPPDFINNVVPKYPALQQRVKSPVRFSRANPFSPHIDLDQLDIPEHELLQEIGAKLLPIFEIAYTTQLDRAVQVQNINTLADAAVNSYLATNHRRLFVKALITEWSVQVENGEHLIDAEYAERAIRNENQALDTLADSQQRPY
ncbi:MAG: BREX system ATP-binding domain-containing protein [Aggregatilineales bacterium]